MSSEQDYKLIYKKWYFWIPLVLMIVTFGLWIIFIFNYLGGDKELVFLIYLLLFIFNTILIICSYLFINRIVHIICGAFIIIIIIIYYISIKDSIFNYNFKIIFYFILPIILNLSAGLFLIILTFLKINPSHSVTT